MENLYDDQQPFDDHLISSSDDEDPLLAPGSETNVEPLSKRAADTPGDESEQLRKADTDPRR